MGKRRRSSTSVIVLAVVYLLISSVALAETIGNPVNTLESGSFRLTAEVGMWERDMDLEGDTGTVEGNRVFAKGTYGLNENLCFFAKVGMTSSEFNLYGVADVETDMELAFGVGGKFNFYNEGQLKAGVVVQVTKLSGEDAQDISNEYIPGYGTVSGTLKGELDALEIDFGVGASYEVDDSILCYGGLYYSKLSVDLEASLNSTKLVDTDSDEEDPIGLFVGGEYNLNEKLHVGAELRVVAEKSFSVFCGFTF